MDTTLTELRNVSNEVYEFTSDLISLANENQKLFINLRELLSKFPMKEAKSEEGKKILDELSKHLEVFKNLDDLIFGNPFRKDIINNDLQAFKTSKLVSTIRAQDGLELYLYESLSLENNKYPFGGVESTLLYEFTADRPSTFSKFCFITSTGYEYNESFHIEEFPDKRFEATRSFGVIRYEDKIIVEEEIARIKSGEVPIAKGGRGYAGYLSRWLDTKIGKGSHCFMMID
jgi:hypothetical protein